MKIAFSIPVHENSGVVFNQVQNIFSFNKEALVVLHISKSFASFELSEFRQISNLVINPERLKTTFGKGLMHVHCSNFDCIRSLEFDAFCLLSSNEMFVRAGAADYIEKMQNGFQCVRFDLAEDWHVFNRRIDLHPGMLQLQRLLGISTIYGGQAEGQFFQKGLFAKIVDLYRQAFGTVEVNDFETEEVVPQTIAQCFLSSFGRPITLVDYTLWDVRFTERIASLLAVSSLAGKIFLNLPAKVPEFLRNPHCNMDNGAVFSIKRVARDLADPLRRHISNINPNDISLPLF